MGGFWTGRWTYKEPAVEGFPALAFYGVVCGSAFGGVGTPAGLTLHLGGRGGCGRGLLLLLLLLLGLIGRLQAGGQGSAGLL